MNSRKFRPLMHPLHISSFYSKRAFLLRTLGLLQVIFKNYAQQHAASVLETVFKPLHLG